MPAAKARIEAPKMSPLPRNGRYAARSKATAAIPDTTIATITITRSMKISVNPVRTLLPAGSRPSNLVAAISEPK